MYSGQSNNHAEWIKLKEKFPKSINVQDEIRLCRLEYLKLNNIKNSFAQNFSTINKHAGWTRAVQVGFFQKLNKLCSMFIRQTRVRDK